MKLKLIDFQTVVLNIGRVNIFLCLEYSFLSKKDMNPFGFSRQIDIMQNPK